MVNVRVCRRRGDDESGAFLRLLIYPFGDLQVLNDGAVDLAKMPTPCQHSPCLTQHMRAMNGSDHGSKQRSSALPIVFRQYEPAPVTIETASGPRKMMIETEGCRSEASEPMGEL